MDSIRNPHYLQTYCVMGTDPRLAKRWTGVFVGDGFRASTRMRFADAERAQAYVKRVKARWESKYDQFEHQAMLDAFCARHGTGRDCETTKEKEMWLGWLGSFTLGWDAHKKYVAESLGRH